MRTGATKTKTNLDQTKEDPNRWKIFLLLRSSFLLLDGFTQEQFFSSWQFYSGAEPGGRYKGLHRTNKQTSESRFVSDFNRKQKQKEKKANMESWLRLPRPVLTNVVNRGLTSRWNLHFQSWSKLQNFFKVDQNCRIFSKLIKGEEFIWISQIKLDVPAIPDQSNGAVPKVPKPYTQFKIVTRW